MIHPSTLLAATLLLALSGCLTSSHYTPRSPQARLVMKDNLVSYSKAGKVEALQTDSGTKLLSCSPEAQRLAVSASGDASTAQVLAMIGPALGLIGGFVTGPIAARYQHSANAKSIDAMNVHNDRPECVAAEAKP